MSLPFAVRLAGLEDVPRVVALGDSIPEAPQWTAAMYREFVVPSPDALQRKALLIADCGECLHGFAAATVLAEEAELESIAVAVEARLSGIGSALLDAVVDWSVAEGADALRLEVRASNIAAQAFYESREFQQVGLRRGYYGSPDDDGVQMLAKLLNRLK